MRSIQRVSRKRNPAMGISGLLAYSSGTFVQVLEGEQANVETLYGQLQSDPRHSNLEVLHRGETAERLYASWGMGSVFRMGQAQDAEQRRDFLRSRFGRDGFASSADYFRYLLTPSRQMVTNVTGRVLRVGIMASSALWFTPVFSTITDIYGEKPSSVLVSDPDTIASGFAVDYVDINSTELGLVRITGMGKDLIASPLLGPLLKGIDLLVVLMRNVALETKIEQVRAALALAEVRQMRPDVMCVVPNEDKEIVEAMTTLGAEHDIKMHLRTASLLMGTDVFAQIREWIVAHRMSDAPATHIPTPTQGDSVFIIPASAAPINIPPPLVLTATPALTVAVPDVSVMRASNVEPCDASTAPVLPWMRAVIDRVMTLPGSLSADLVNIETEAVLCAAQSETDAQAEPSRHAGLLSTCRMLRAIAPDDPPEHIVTTSNRRYEVAMWNRASPTLAVSAAFHRDGVLLAPLLSELTALLADCAELMRQ